MSHAIGRCFSATFFQGQAEGKRVLSGESCHDFKGHTEASSTPAASIVDGGHIQLSIGPLFLAEMSKPGDSRYYTSLESLCRRHWTRKSCKEAALSSGSWP